MPTETASAELVTSKLDSASEVNLVVSNDLERSSLNILEETREASEKLPPAAEPCHNAVNAEGDQSELASLLPTRGDTFPIASIISLEDLAASSTATSALGSAMSGEGYIAVCWGCGQHVSLPNYASVFRCGHCGALTYEYDKSVGVHVNVESRTKKRRSRSWIWIRDRITMGFVLFLITFIISGGGVWSAFPILFPSPSISFFLHSVLTLLLLGNTIFNFLCCSCMPAGPVSPLPYGDVTQVPAGSLSDYTLCQQCNPPKPKPARAHHCRQCGDCVVDMDHHCPFIGNCVGQSNQRHFIVFLVWASMSCFYAAGITLTAILRFLPTLDFSPARATLAQFAAGPSSGAFFAMLAKLLPDLVFSLSFRGAVLFYVFGISVGTTPCTAVLLYQQVSYVLEGVTFIDSLKKNKGKGGNEQEQQNGGLGGDQPALAPSQRGSSRKGAGKWDRRMMLLRGVFGSGPVWTWLIPRFLPPPGAKAYQQRKQ